MTDDLEHRLADDARAAPGLDLDRLRAALARRAADDRLLDVAHGTYDSPLGTLTVIVTPLAGVSSERPMVAAKASSSRMVRSDQAATLVRTTAGTRTIANIAARTVRAIDRV